MVESGFIQRSNIEVLSSIFLTKILFGLGSIKFRVWKWGVSIHDTTRSYDAIKAIKVSFRYWHAFRIQSNTQGISQDLKHYPVCTNFKVYISDWKLRHLHSDNGSLFTSNDFVSYCERWKIEFMPLSLLKFTVNSLDWNRTRVYVDKQLLWV